jgi:hypothetical protein
MMRILTRSSFCVFIFFCPLHAGQILSKLPAPHESLSDPDTHHTRIFYGQKYNGLCVNVEYMIL